MAGTASATTHKSSASTGIFRDFERTGRTERYHVSAANDPEEQRAEQTADAVTGGDGIFRAADGPGMEGGEAELSTADISDAGQSLPADLEQSMGASMGADFSGVRVHTGEGADRASESLSARAFAKGQDIYFRKGEYDPSSQGGQHLLAHELAHVASGADGLHRWPNWLTFRRRNAAQPNASTTGSTPSNGNTQTSGGTQTTGNTQTTGSAPATGNTQTTGSAPATGNTQTTGSAPATGNTQTTGGTQTTQNPPPPPPAPLTDAEKQQEKDRFKAIKDDFESANIADLEKEYHEKSMEEHASTPAAMQTETDRVNKADNALNNAETLLEEMKTKANDDATNAAFYNAQATEIEALLTANRTKVDTLKTSIEKEQARTTDMPLSDSVKSMLLSPYFEQFFRAARKLRKAGGDAGFADAEEKAAENAGSSDSGMSAEKKRDYLAHENALRGKDTGIQKAKDSSQGLGKAGAFASALGASTDAVSGDSGAVQKARGEHSAATEYGTAKAAIQKEKDGLEKETDAEKKKAGEETIKEKEDAAKEKYEQNKQDAADKGDAVAGIVSGAGGAASAIGGGLNVAQNSKDAAAQRKQDQRAKQNMRALAGRLERTLSEKDIDAIPAAGQPGGSRPADSRTWRIQQVCQRVKQNKFNDSKVSLATLIGDAMAPGLTPELTDTQKGLLTALQAVESSRASSKEKASQLRKEAIFGSFDTLSTALKAAGSLTTGISALSGSTMGALIGSILTLAGSVIGQISALRKSISPESEGGEEAQKKEKDDKMAASRSAIQQMSALPEINKTEKESLVKKAGGQNVPVGGEAVDKAEQYAAAFFTIESANINMADILFAIEKGGFGQGKGTANAKTAAASLNDMYANLSFS